MRTEGAFHSHSEKDMFSRPAAKFLGILEGAARKGVRGGSTGDPWVPKAPAALDPGLVGGWSPCGWPQPCGQVQVTRAAPQASLLCVEGFGRGEDCRPGWL